MGRRDSTGQAVGPAEVSDLSYDDRQLRNQKEVAHVDINANSEDARTGGVNEATRALIEDARSALEWHMQGFRQASNSNVETACERLDEALLALDTSGWQPIATMPECGPPVLVHWQKSLIGAATIEIVGSAEYLELLGYGEPPATHWMPLPAAPLFPAAREAPASGAVSLASDGESQTRDV